MKIKYRDTMYELLRKIANVVDREERKAKLRELCYSDNFVATVIQRIYHPDYNFDLYDYYPKGTKPEEIGRLTNHTDPNSFIATMRKWECYRPEHESGRVLQPKLRARQFAQDIETVAAEDAIILVAVKDKELPWKTLDAEFCVEAMPELFPDTFLPETSETDNEEKYNFNVAKRTGSKKAICRKIFADNPDLDRKAYIKLFRKAVDISENTASLYHAEFRTLTEKGE